MAINDCIEMAARWPAEKIAAVDAELRANGLITLSTIRRRFSKRLHSILKRGRIRTEVEYYLVRGAIEDPAIAADEVTTMRNLLTAFETKFRGYGSKTLTLGHLRVVTDAPR